MSSIFTGWRAHASCVQNRQVKQMTNKVKVKENKKNSYGSD